MTPRHVIMLIVAGIMLAPVGLILLVFAAQWAGRMMGRPDERGFNQSINAVNAIVVIVRDEAGSLLDQGYETKRIAVVVSGATAAVTVRGSRDDRWLLTLETATGSAEAIVTDPLPFERRMGPVVITVENT